MQMIVYHGRIVELTCGRDAAKDPTGRVWAFRSRRKDGPYRSPAAARSPYSLTESIGRVFLARQASNPASLPIGAPPERRPPRLTPAGPSADLAGEETPGRRPPPPSAAAGRVPGAALATGGAVGDNVDRMFGVESPMTLAERWTLRAPP